jgi:hypothetical protein
VVGLDVVEVVAAGVAEADAAGVDGVAVVAVVEVGVAVLRPTP